MSFGAFDDALINCVKVLLAPFKVSNKDFIDSSDALLSFNNLYTVADF